MSAALYATTRGLSDPLLPVRSLEYSNSAVSYPQLDSGYISSSRQDQRLEHDAEPASVRNDLEPWNYAIFDDSEFRARDALSSYVADPYMNAMQLKTTTMMLACIMNGMRLGFDIERLMALDLTYQSPFYRSVVAPGRTPRRAACGGASQRRRRAGPSSANHRTGTDPASCWP